MSLTGDDDQLLLDLREFIHDAQRVEAALAAGRLEEARLGLAHVSGLAMGLASRAGVAVSDDFDRFVVRRKDQP